MLKDVFGNEIKSLPLVVIGARVVIAVLENVVKFDSQIIKQGFNYQKEFLNFYPGKDKERKVTEMYLETRNHPFRAVIIALGKEAEEQGLKLGDVVFGGQGLLLSRDVIQVDEILFPLVGLHSIYGVVDNVKLNELKIQKEN